MAIRSEGDETGSTLGAYERRMLALRNRFDGDGDGVEAVHNRTEAVDQLVSSLWQAEITQQPALASGISLAAVGGYGRRELFPFSDVDLLVCTEKNVNEAAASAIRRLSQRLWDGGLRASVVTRSLGDAERFKATDPEGSLALLDLRPVCGHPALGEMLIQKLHRKRSSREARSLAAAAAQLTRERQARFGHTLFHLEPNVKDTPGGLRDANVTRWFALLRGAPQTLEEAPGPFEEAFRFLTALRVFLHLRHDRDDNTLDWHAQDEAAAAGVGVLPRRSGPDQPLDPAYWMRFYFRHARAIERALTHEVELAGQQPRPSRSALRARAPARSGFTVDDGLLNLKQARADLDPAADPEIVLGAFGLMAETGLRLTPASDDRIATAVPAFSAALEDGPLLWSRLRRVLCGRFAGHALRSMHALGLLDLIIPEFHGIDALVIRDAYHRYTVDEHTFVLLDALHALADDPPPGAPDWRRRFRHLLEDLSHPELLFLAALLHDTGKARANIDHARASAQLAEGVTRRLELETFDRQLVSRLIDSHLEMSAALRRDIFDAETVRAFADKVGTHDLLRMLTLFTYADISAVHPDALTPWKAENLWRLWMAAENQLDRSVDQDRVHAGIISATEEASSIARALGLGPAQRGELERFLEGAPERYLRTRAPEAIRLHMELARKRDVQVLLATGSASSEITVLTASRPGLFADLSGALAAWGMNIVSAEAFSNAGGVVVDTFRFTDPYRTLELNPEERERFRQALESVVRGNEASITELLRARRRPRRTKPRRLVETRVEFDNMSSAQSTLMQVVAQDAPGLLREISLALNECGCSIEVALIDTEGEMAIDVFYLTLRGNKLDEAEQLRLRELLASHIQRAPAFPTGPQR